MVAAFSFQLYRKVIDDTFEGKIARPRYLFLVDHMRIQGSKLRQ